ncbi:PAZ domain-containing protein [Artemisia annua]|uniref:PAZ domain-containing protein n=1 Tax=Artemisia annua TaxID=35608 RepID=A0A2U1QNB3_ARTAN|nr:PAZ domain-containing protein [Artemisia annua]
MRCYKVQAVKAQSTSELNFEDENGATKTVVQSFMEKHNVQLEYPYLPAIQAGNDVKPIYLLMEICRITKGQKYGLKLNERQVTKFLTATCQRPSARQKGISDTMKTNNYNNNYGLVRGRAKTQLAGRFIYGLVSICKTKGIVFESRPLTKMCSATPDNIETALSKLGSKCSARLQKRFGSKCSAQLQMLFVILPEDKGAYPRIKGMCETDLGIVSQCFKPQNVVKLSNRFFENVAMKINVKVRGRNTILSATLNGRLPYVTERPTIIFGADVTHPSPGEDSSPSIAGVVASMDWPLVTKYKALISAQPHRQEIISDLYTTSNDPERGVIHGGLIRELLISFKHSTGHKPHRIIFYRDGVSEGQFNEVLLNEMVKIREACLSLEENYMPPVTFIVVQKRHHTRFFPLNYSDRASTDASDNILPGTVVDTKICHPTEFDFYLCSHAGIKGTSRPTHYHVLFDENQFTADGLQLLTNSLCYTYQRCTRSVSVVPPAYYAHLAAFRARSYMEGDFPDSDSSSPEFARNTRDRVAAVRPLRVIHENVKSVMYYC